MNTQASIVSEVDALRARERRIALALLVITPPPLVAFLLLGMPVIGSVVMLSLADQLGCTVNAAGSHPCFLAGTDIGDVVYNYAIASLFQGVTNPLHMFQLAAKFVPGWLLWYGTMFWIMSVVALFTMGYMTRERLQELRSRSQA